MSSPETIFRQEALESWVRGRDRSGGVVRLGARWRTWLYRLTIALVLAGILGLLLVRTDEHVTGRAVVDQRTGSVTALLPAASAPDLAGSEGLRVDISGDGAGPVPVVTVRAHEADDAAVRAAGLKPLSQPGILLTGRIPTEPPGSAAAGSTVPATATVLLRSERLVDLLARQFGALLGHGEGRR